MLALSVLATAWASQLRANCLRTAADIAAYADGKPSAPVPYAITGVVTKVSRREFYFQDRSGIAKLSPDARPFPAVGDIITATGVILFDEYGNTSSRRNSKFTVIGHTTPPAPLSIPLEKIDANRHHYRQLITEGQIVDIVKDDVDDTVLFLILRDGRAQYPVAMNANIVKGLPNLLEARIRITGQFCRRNISLRTHSGPCILADASPEILIPPPADPFAAPVLTRYPLQTPQQIAAQSRRSVAGKVIAAWSGNSMLIRTPDGAATLVRLLDDCTLPEYGQTIKAVGSPGTDLFDVNLTHALWRPEPAVSVPAEEAPADAPFEQLTLENLKNDPKVMRRLHGHAIRLTGIVSHERRPDIPLSQLKLMSGDSAVTVDAGTSALNLGAIAANSEVSVTGVCVFEGENWSADRIFPHLKSVKLVLRVPRDLTIVKNPPWWTAGRLAAVIAVLFLGLLGVMLWNRALNRLVNRRGHELAREKLKKESAQLKIGERTRLAVELHDSLSQNLEGVACQLVASRNMMKANPPSAAGCLDTAERMLDSCRLELRRCLFDLRGHALEEQNFADAIRSTLAPLCDGVDLVVRFDVRRAHFDDTTVHAILCMVRELVSNALRHGHATQIRVAGEYHDGTLSFSVRDNGCGFDAEARPGPSQGHFGLEGIRERAERLDGTAVIESHPGTGTRIAVTLHISEGKDAEPA